MMTSLLWPDQVSHTNGRMDDDRILAPTLHTQKALFSIPHSTKMPAVNTVVAREALSTIAKRSNWAGREAGVVVVFCIVFIVAVGLVGLFISKRISARKANKASH
ncbi:hypothetical protein DL546_008117 [Coniochaeta pulveracea]|uniref:Uncharacterized protein n=1 Tax=Coniochaeta pulveracea TaxID=177199 RepID=A0A420YCV7_9PEZI|nr:hypothetical protein DL546_008117 [Coniochaeta pulveracea]